MDERRYSHYTYEPELNGQEVMCVGCTRYHWSIAARVFLCILTLGLSELIRGSQGWCRDCFVSQTAPPHMANWRYDYPIPAGTQLRGGEMDSRSMPGQFVYPPSSTFSPGELERRSCTTAGLCPQSTGFGETSHGNFELREQTASPS
jgi:hypothetical protein